MAPKRPHLSAAAAAVLALGLSACGSGAAADNSGADQPRQLRLANVFEPTHPFNTCGTERLAERVAELSDGSLEISVFPAAQLGKENEHLEALVAGQVDLAINGFAFLAEYAPELSIMEAAYAFDDPDHLDAVVDGEVGQELAATLQESSGIELLDVWYYGTRHMTGSAAYRSPEDLDGVKVRVPDAPLYIANLEAMGGSPTPVAFTELYLALSQGVVDAQENPLPTIEAGKFMEVQDVLSLTGHMVQGQGFVTTEAVLDGLDDDQRTALTDALAQVGPEVRTCIEDQETELVEQYRSGGEVEVVDDVDTEAFRDASEQVVDEFADQWGDLYERIRAEA